jgi:hypothetical protein
LDTVGWPAVQAAATLARAAEATSYLLESSQFPSATDHAPSPGLAGIDVRFEVVHATGASHEVELQGTVATLGRDPTCDLVLNDPKCSRRHAVLEAGPQGIAIRDSGSANGIYLNGRKIERSALKEGDVVKLGDSSIKVLPEDIPGTLVMEDLDMAATGSRPAPAPPVRRAEPTPPRSSPSWPTHPDAPSAALPRPSRPAAAPVPDRVGERPMTVSVLAALWIMSLPLYAVAGLLLARDSAGLGAIGYVLAGLFLATLSGLMAWGLWSGRAWARVLQLVIAALGIFFCPFTLASITVLIYMLRPGPKAHFAGRPAPEGQAQAEPAFSAALVGMVVLGALIVGAFTFLARTARSLPPGGTGISLLERAKSAGAERAATGQMQEMAAAQAAFHAICNSGYADLPGLLDPAAVVPNYPAGGPAFLPREGFSEPERGGYRYTLSVDEEIPPTPACPTRRFRRYTYSATPLGPGRHLMVGSDAVVRVADGRPAGTQDPPLGR